MKKKLFSDFQGWI